MKTLVFYFVFVIFLVFAGVNYFRPVPIQQKIQYEDSNPFNIKDTVLNYTMKGHGDLKIILDTTDSEIKDIELRYLYLAEVEKDSIVFSMNTDYLYKNRDKQIASFYSQKLQEYVMLNKGSILNDNNLIIDKYDRFMLTVFFYVNKSPSD